MSARETLWTTSDEPVHLASAREWRFGPGMVSNFEHPVLMKVVAGLGLAREKPARGIDETRAGRTLFPFFFALLVFVAGLWTTRRAGPVAGIAVAALLALEPTVRGHGGLATNDVLLTVFLVASAAALNVASLGNLRRFFVAAGILCGFALASKYSALPFLLVFAALATAKLVRMEFFASKGNRGSEARKPVADRAKRNRVASPPIHLLRRIFSAVGQVSLWLVAPAILTVALIQAISFSSTSDSAFRAGLDAEFRGLPQEPAVHRLANALPNWAASYGAGLLFVQGVAGPGERFNYFFGKVSGKGFPLYFPVALAIKLTAATLLGFLAALLAAGISFARAATTKRRRLLFLFIERCLVPFYLGLLWLLGACLSNVNIGVRHALPVVPFALVVAAGAGRTLFRRRPHAFRLVLLLVVAGAGLEAAAHLGREISFGNVFVGGPRGVPAILSDSNVDWSQEQGKVFDRVRRADLGRAGIVTLVVDEGEARAAGLAWVDRPDVAVDAVFFSRHLWDLAGAVEKSPETWPKFTWLRSWLPPLAHGIDKRARSVEPFGDAYLLFRLNAPGEPPAPTR